MHHRIEIVGTGCPRCKVAYRMVRDVVNEEQIDAEVIEVDSFTRVLNLGVLAEPAILVDGVIVCTGRVPDLAEIHEFLGAPVPA